jgi:hypothetical protein
MLQALYLDISQSIKSTRKKMICFKAQKSNNYYLLTHFAHFINPMRQLMSEILHKRFKSVLEMLMCRNI